jgi:hypothetical protein
MSKAIYKNGVVPQQESESLSQNGLPAAHYFYEWSGTSDTDNFRTIKKKITFDNKMSAAPTEIRLSNTELLNCTTVKVKKITDSGFTIAIVGLRAAQNSVGFDWEAVA